MKEDPNGQETAQDAQREGRPQESETQPITTADDVSAYEAQIAERDAEIAERDGRISELEGKLADAEKLGQQAESLKSKNVFVNSFMNISLCSF